MSNEASNQKRKEHGAIEKAEVIAEVATSAIALALAIIAMATTPLLFSSYEVPSDVLQVFSAVISGGVVGGLSIVFYYEQYRRRARENKKIILEKEKEFWKALERDINPLLKWGLSS